MKKFLLFFLCALLLLPCVPALGESAYPGCQGPVTDLAGVLDERTAEDLGELSARYDNAVDGSIYVITRHFLGGKDARDYAAALFDAWGLNENDMLFLVVVGEENYALHLGEKAAQVLPDEMAQTYLSATFHSDFMARRYDTAVSALCVQAAQRIASAQGETLSAAGLFGTAADEKSPAQVFVQDFTGLFSTLLDEDDGDEQKDNDRSVLKEDKSTGISIWKVILVIIILRALFGKKRRRFNFGHHPRR